MREYTEEELAFIEGIELTLDYGFSISDEDFEKYVKLTKDKGDINA